MPSFSDYHDFEIEIDDFLNECSSNEIEEIIQWLIDEDHIKEDDVLYDLSSNSSSTSVLEQLFIENLDKIKNSYLQISKEDFELINQIAKKY